MPNHQIAQAHHVRAQWKSRMGFILAAIGSAIGLGNIWRFSYLCYKNGGGAFLVPYLIALCVIGVPLMILELGIGHKMRGSSPMSLAKVDRHWEWCGWWAVICAMYGIMLYYSVVIAWCLSYVFFSFNLAWGTDPNDFFFNQYLQISSGPFDLGDIRFPIIAALLAVWFLSWLIVYFGVQKGVELSNKIFMPLLLTLTLILVFWSVSLEGAGEGIAVYLKPDFSKLAEPEIWIDAFSQIFFTLSLAFGIMIAYASYLPRKVNIVKDAVIICFGNCAFSLLSGFAVFGTLGYMAHTLNQPVSEVVKESIGLAFVAYPQAISLMPVMASVFGVLFFSSLVIAGLSSAVSLVEAFSSSIMDKFNVKRETVVTFVCISGFSLSIIFTAKSGLFWVDIVDHFITHYGLVLIGLLECLVIGWVFKASRLREHINHASDKILSPFWDVCIRFIAPTVLAALLINDFSTEIQKPYGDYPWLSIVMIGRDWLMVALIAALIVSMRRWKREVEEEKEHQ
ncbi:MAG: sodium-dependent transporter [Candidatus Omnitrophica bacterium]|nr:sodium-dependent transporter [Candidatus Omnitrophota bacterium]